MIFRGGNIRAARQNACIRRKLGQRRGGRPGPWPRKDWFRMRVQPNGTAAGAGVATFAWWTERLAEPSFVYVIQADEGTPLKVGRARDVIARLGTLQTGNPYRLRVRYVLPGDHELEWQLHQKVAKHRLQGEWFEAAAASVLFPLCEALGRAMRDAYDGGGEVPTYRQPGFTWRRVRHPKGTVRWIEPTPVPPHEAKARLVRAWMGTRFDCPIRTARGVAS